MSTLHASPKAFEAAIRGAGHQPRRNSVNVEPRAQPFAADVDIEAEAERWGQSLQRDALAFVNRRR